MTEMEAIRLGRHRTLGHLVQHQLTLWMHCRKCRRPAKLDVQRLIQRHGAEMVLKALQLSWVCGHCGAGWPDVPYGVRDFKASFGGELVCYGRYRHVYSPWKMALAERVYEFGRTVISPK